ncbi:ABC transporter substrate-binding protein [Paenibacillus macerans]|uniref:ABC transporter substrate-binding protein n=2 Tax=Paenibacillus macerans TaxID=44252 RepID=A0A6N8F2A7_PAEMA|nr:ABC transporter substrate-binding protein [Paenibacillus macerans]MUG26546.1 ABC transporter substrate-binding protein [Paenibacillus macerans]
MKRKWFSLSKISIGLLATVMLLAACGSAGEQPSPPAAPAQAAPGAAESAVGGQDANPSPDGTETVVFTDSAGREVEIPKHIERIAPSGSLAQIVLFSLAPDKLVGLSGKWSDEAGAYLADKYLQLPVFGQFYGSGDLNMEALAAAKPQLIIDIGEKKDGIAEDLDALQEQLGIPVIFVEATLKTMAGSYNTLGEVLGMPDEAKVLADYCDEVYTNTVKTMEKIGDHKVKVLYSLGDTGTNIISKGSFHAEILDLLGDNVAVLDNPSSKGSGNEVSLEQIVQWDPDVIFFAPLSIYGSVASDGTWKQMKAIRDGNYFEVPGAPYSWMGSPPSVNRYIGMIWLSQTLYPDVFKYDLRAEVNRFYKLFYHSGDLTDEQYKALTQNAVKS